jgi:hypothetical protein
MIGIGGEKLVWYGDDVNNVDTNFSENYGSIDAEVWQQFAETEGAVRMGRKTFNFSTDAWGDEPPIHKPCFVLTHRSIREWFKIIR